MIDSGYWIYAFGYRKTHPESSMEEEYVYCCSRCKSQYTFISHKLIVNYGISNEEWAFFLWWIDNKRSLKCSFDDAHFIWYECSLWAEEYYTSKRY